MKDFGLLILRVVFGGLMMGHGGQKLFGWFSGPGLKGTSGWLESMGLKPGDRWALLAGGSEFSGGLLSLLGFLNPLGALGSVGSMLMAATKVHWGKPIWVTSGGAELPLTNIAIALTLGMTGPGKFSLDNALHIRLSRRMVLIPGLLLTAAGVAAGLVMSNRASTAPAAEESKQAQSQAGTRQEQPEAVRVPERPTAAEGEPVGTENASQEQSPEANLQADQSEAQPS